MAVLINLNSNLLLQVVNTKYQSVHGVRINIKNPIKMSKFPFKNIEPIQYPNNRVHMKLIIRWLM